MRRLGGQFPKAERRQYAKRQIVPGQVLYLFCGFADPPKDKYIVLLTGGPKPSFFVVNSSVPGFMVGRPFLERCQVELPVADHSFLEHDSFINCAEVKEEFAEDDIVAQLAFDPSRAKGMASATVRGHVLRAVRGAMTISPSHKEAIELALTEQEADEQV